jgi:xanthine/CO dehydrogenase XdhC/CoxF family maturation factor
MLTFYRARRKDRALVLGTVTATSGSTYRKPGAMMLIGEDGGYHGLISGGCLEADLAAHALAVFEDGKSRNVCYDMSHGDDFAWGLGLGCDGVVHLLLQYLGKDDNFGFLDLLDQAHQARHSGLLSLVTASTDQEFEAGDFALDCGPELTGGRPELLSSPCSAEGTSFSGGHDMSRRYWHDTLRTAGGELELLLVPVMPPPALLICGAGHDALPVARFASEMGWDCTVVDHRPGYARQDRFPESCRVLTMNPADLSEHVTLDDIDATVVMSHNLGHDRSYLEQITGARIPYIGLLGPRARRDRLLDEVNATNIHVHGPAGLDIGAELPESIALAIVAEIHAFLNGRNGQMLTEASK